MSRSTANTESKIVTYFQTAPVAEARLVFNIIKGVIAARSNEVMKVPAPAPAPARRPHRANPLTKKRVRRTNAQIAADKAAAANASGAQAGEAIAASAILGS